MHVRHHGSMSGLCEEVLCIVVYQIYDMMYCRKACSCCFWSGQPVVFGSPDQAKPHGIDIVTINCQSACSNLMSNHCQ